MSAFTTGGIGAEIIPSRGADASAAASGAAPWERRGANLAPPGAPVSVAAAERWEAERASLAAADADSAARRAARVEERRRKKEEAEEARKKKLERTARRYFLLGFFALPFVWFVNFLYFRKDLADPETSPSIKKHVRLSGIFFVVYTLLFIAWVVAYQVWAGRTTGLHSLSILRGDSKLQ